MANSSLAPEVTDFMREYMEEGISRGESHEQLRARAAELTLICNCTRNQVSGAIAWKRKNGGKKLVLEKLVIPEMNIDQETGAQPLEKTVAQVDIQNLDKTDELNERIHDNNGIVFHPKGGAWADYEHSKIKEVWRRQEADFIDRNVEKDPVTRGKMRILCTPGIKCYLEVDLLLKLGFMPENIIAVEREKKAWKDFESNAQKVGVIPVFGDLEQVINNMNSPFDIVCLDFVSSGSIRNMEILSKLPLTRKAVIVLNVMAKREDTEFQYEMGRLHKIVSSQSDFGQDIFRSGLDDLMQKIRDGKRFSDDEYSAEIRKVTTDVFKAVDDYVDSDNDMSWDERETMLWYMQRYAGTSREESWLAPNMIKKITLPPDVLSALPEKLERASAESQKRASIMREYKFLSKFFAMWATELLSYDDPDERLFHVQKIGDLLFAATFGRRQILAYEKVKYKSKIGQTTTPFCTSMALTELPKDDYRKYLPLVSFALTHVKSAYEKEGLLKIIPSYSNAGHPSFSLAENGKKIISISFDDLLNQLKDYFEIFSNKYPLSSWKNQHLIPWKDLSKDS